MSQFITYSYGSNATSDFARTMDSLLDKHDTLGRCGLMEPDEVKRLLAKHNRPQEPKPQPIRVNLDAVTMHTRKVVAEAIRKAGKAVTPSDIQRTCGKAVSLNLVCRYLRELRGLGMVVKVRRGQYQWRKGARA